MVQASVSGCRMQRKYTSSQMSPASKLSLPNSAVDSISSCRFRKPAQSIQGDCRRRWIETAKLTFGCRTQIVNRLQQGLSKVGQAQQQSLRYIC